MNRRRTQEQSRCECFSAPDSPQAVPISEKYTLTIKEASAYFNIGVKRMRRMAEDNLGRFAVYSGNKHLIIRTKFEKFIEESSAI